MLWWGAGERFPVGTLRTHTLWPGLECYDSHWLRSDLAGVMVRPASSSCFACCCRFLEPFSCVPPTGEALSSETSRRHTSLTGEPEGSKEPAMLRQGAQGAMKHEGGGVILMLHTQKICNRRWQVNNVLLKLRGT